MAVLSTKASVMWGGCVGEDAGLAGWWVCGRHRYRGHHNLYHQRKYDADNVVQRHVTSEMTWKSVVMASYSLGE